MTRGPSVRGLLLAGLALGGAAALWQGLRHYDELEVLRPAPGDDTAPLPVAVIIPARNEEANLRGLLPTLNEQTRPPAEIIVVDDESTDRTVAMAQALGARVLPSGGPPTGWTGKAWACQLGAEASSAPWLLFTDADTRHAPGSLAAAVVLAEARGWDLLSLFPVQDCRTPGERLFVPYAFGGYFAGVRPGTVNRSAAEAMCNGQYVLVRRDAWLRVGGHAAVAASLVEDVELGMTLVASGVRAGMVRADQPGPLGSPDPRVGVRMYRSAGAVLAGFAKNSFGFTRLQPRRGLVIAAASTASAASLPLLALALRPAASGGDRLLAAATLAVSGHVAGSWAARFGAPRWYGLLQPLSASLLLAVALRSMLAGLGGPAVAWKGRTYRPSGAAAAPTVAARLPRGRRIRPDFPWHRVPGLMLTVFLGRDGDMRADSAAMVDGLPAGARVDGIEQVPADGAVCLVANHYQRRGLWIGWAGGLLGSAVATRRPTATPPVHWLVIGDYRVRALGRRWTLPFTGWAFGRMARAWGATTLAGDLDDRTSHAGSMRGLLGLARAGRVIGIFPDGQFGTAGVPGEALPGMDRMLAHLAKRGATILPVAVREWDGSLVARIGPPLTAAELARPMDPVRALYHAIETAAAGGPAS